MWALHLPQATSCLLCVLYSVKELSGGFSTLYHVIVVALSSPRASPPNHTCSLVLAKYRARPAFIMHTLDPQQKCLFS
jgi:hypothetical protein